MPGNPRKKAWIRHGKSPGSAGPGRAELSKRDEGCERSVRHLRIALGEQIARQLFKRRGDFSLSCSQGCPSAGSPVGPGKGPPKCSMPM